MIEMNRLDIRTTSLPSGPYFCGLSTIRRSLCATASLDRPWALNPLASLQQT